MRLVEEHGERWLVTPYGAMEKAGNVPGGGAVILSRNGHSEIVRVAELKAPQARPVPKISLSEATVTSRFFGMTRRSSGEATLDDRVAEAARHPVFVILR